MSERPEDAPLTMREAGAKGGRRTAELYGSEHYQRIGRLGGSRVRELIQKAKAAEPAEKGDGDE